jgi:glycosyltransferase involved in cell wall biosynthesis
MKDLISFCITCYNQEEFIKESIESALAQDYDNLEIIISDDCSKDKTYEIAQEIVNNYIGIHKVYLFRNDKNLGISENRNRVLRKAKGSWIISQDGDDKSFSNRASIISKYIVEANLFAIYTATVGIDENNRKIKYNNFDFKNEIMLSGSNASYSKKIVDLFEPLRNDSMDDTTLLFRSLLLGNILIIDTPTVYDRESFDFVNYLRKRVQYRLLLLNSYKQRQDDIFKSKNFLQEDIYSFFYNKNQDYLKITEFFINGRNYEKEKFELEIYLELNFFRRIQKIIEYKKINISEKIKLIIWTNNTIRKTILTFIMVFEKRRNSIFTNKYRIVNYKTLKEQEIIVKTINSCYPNL